MKRIIIAISIFLILLVLTIINLSTKKEDNKIVVAEVTHSVFYSPWYVALHNNYFDNLKIEVILTSGANNVTAAVLSGDANIGLCGPEATIYIYNNNKNNYIRSFAGLTKRDGQFLVLRKDIKYNNFNDINNLNILAGRTGGMPYINFKNALKNKNILNVNVDTSVDFANLTSAFISGQGDGVNLFEPNATTLVKNGYGYIADSIGTYSGEVPYTAFNAKKEYIENNKDIINKFYKGIEKGLEYVTNHTPKEIANIIKDEFPNTTEEDLTIMIDNYKKADSWLKTPKISNESFINLENMLIDNKLIDKQVPFNDLIYEIN